MSQDKRGYWADHTLNLVLFSSSPNFFPAPHCVLLFEVISSLPLEPPHTLPNSHVNHWSTHSSSALGFHLANSSNQSTIARLQKGLDKEQEGSWYTYLARKEAPRVLLECSAHCFTLSSLHALLTCCRYCYCDLKALFSHKFASDSHTSRFPANAVMCCYPKIVQLRTERHRRPLRYRYTDSNNIQILCVFMRGSAREQRVKTRAALMSWRNSVFFYIYFYSPTYDGPASMTDGLTYLSVA